MAHDLRTKSGKDLFEVISAIQKTIRRGDEYKAMHFALDMIPQYEKYLWRRLMVIANEDIGIADPDVLRTIPSLRAQYFFFRSKGKGSAKLMLANAILLMCRAKKTRVSDHFQCVVQQNMLQRGERLDIPDYAYDKHTRRGKAKGRSWDHFRDVGTQLSNEGDVDDPYEDEAFDLWPTMVDDDWGKAKTDDDMQLSMF